MRATKMLACVGTLIVCLAVPTLGVAEDNCSGYMINVEGKRVSVSSDPNVPGYPQIGECQETGTAFGSCTYRDQDGDEYTLEWRAVPGSPGSGGR
jgi:hypothetical protein